MDGWTDDFIPELSTLRVCMRIYSSIYIYINMYIYVYIIYIYRERERERDVAALKITRRDRVAGKLRDLSVHLSQLESSASWYPGHISVLPNPTCIYIERERETGIR